MSHGRRAAGDEVDVTVAVAVAVDTAPRTVRGPAELAALLDAEPPAKTSFDGLSPSQRAGRPR